MHTTLPIHASKALDGLCDYIPLASTITNLIDLFYKCVILPFLSQETIQAQPLYTRLQEKSFVRCCILLVPVLGNIIIAFLDCCKKRPAYDLTVPQLHLPPVEGMDPLEERLLEEEPLADVEEVLTNIFEEKGIGHMILGYSGNRLSGQEKASLARVRANGLALREESEEIKKHFDIVKTAVESNGLALEFADLDLQDDQEIVEAALRNNLRALQFASDRLVKMIVEIERGALEFANDAAKDNEEIVAASVRLYPNTLRFASERLRENRALVERAIQDDPNVFAYAGETLRDNEEIIDKALRRDGWVLQHASARLKNKFAEKAAEKNGLILQIAGNTNKDVVLAAIQNNPDAMSFASAALQNDPEVINAARLAGSGWRFLDTICDYTPFVSTISNIWALFLKCIVMPFLSRETIEGSSYLYPLHEKSFARCCSLLAPGIGNIAARTLDYQAQIKSAPQEAEESEEESPPPEMELPVIDAL